MNRIDHRAAVRRAPSGLQRRGFAIMVTVVALGIVSAISILSLQTVMSDRRQARREALAAQAEWLAESGLDIAAALIRKDRESDGTIWKVPVSQFGASDSAVVTVKIDRVSGNDFRRQVHVLAEYPAASPQPIRRQIVRYVDL